MKTSIKPTLSIGIPAHNEELNIAKLLKSIFKQISRNYRLEKVYVVCDGCTDQTKPIVKEISKHQPKIILFSDGLRLGKLERLNQIYQLNKSDYLLTLDADIGLSSATEIDKMVEVFNLDSTARVVGGNMFPKPPQGFLERVLYVNNLIWNLVRVSVNDGNHISNLYGAASMLTNEFAKTVKYPPDITCDEEYLYVKSYLTNSFRLAKKTKFIFRSPSTIKEVRLQGTRFREERYMLIPYFGPSVIQLHHVPLKNKVLATLKIFLRYPLLTLFSLLLNEYISAFPFFDRFEKKGQWSPALTTKKL